MRRTILLIGVFALALSARDEGTGTSGSRTTTPAASASGSAESSPSDAATEALVGTWLGPVYEGYKEVTWSFSVTIKECEPGAECGRLQETMTKQPGQDASWLPPSDSLPPSLPCDGTLTYERTEGNAFVFQEMWESGPCSTADLYLTPLPSGDALGVQEYWEGSFGATGYLLPEHYFPGHL